MAEEREYTKEKFYKYLRNIFDFSFKNFITVETLRFIYWIDVVLGALLVAFTIVAGFGESMALGILALIVAPILFILYLIVLRVILEAVAVIFKIADHVQSIADMWESKMERKEVEEIDE